MSIKPVFAALVAAVAVSATQADTLSFASEYTVDYSAAELGSAGAFLSAGFSGFNWSLSSSFSAVSAGGVGEVSATFALPSFTITVNPGFALSDLSLFIGNIVFNEYLASSSATLAAEVSIDGGATQSLLWSLDRSVTSPPGVFEGGYYALDTALTSGGFSTASFSGATLTLVADTGVVGVFGSVVAQPQNQLQIALHTAPTMAPVPEPETVAMMLAGLITLASLTRRRQR